jgi:uncharacterized protein (DUF2147 family)
MSDTDLDLIMQGFDPDLFPKAGAIEATGRMRLRQLQNSYDRSCMQAPNVPESQYQRALVKAMQELDETTAPASGKAVVKKRKAAGGEPPAAASGQATFATGGVATATAVGETELAIFGETQLATVAQTTAATDGETTANAVGETQLAIVGETTSVAKAKATARPPTGPPPQHLHGDVMRAFARRQQATSASALHASPKWAPPHIVARWRPPPQVVSRRW